MTVHGFCFLALQLALESLATGDDPVDPERFATAESLLWAQLPALPLFQPRRRDVGRGAVRACPSSHPCPDRTCRWRSLRPVVTDK